MEDIMKYTVKEISNLANITIKKLYHYHKIGLLVPSEISEAGYRYYGLDELKRLQKILFYKELNIPLIEIKKLMDDDSNRISTLEEQRNLFEKKIQRFNQLIQTLNLSLDYTRNSQNMDNKLLFKGFETEEDWKNALEEQNNHLQDEYNFEIETNSINVDDMNKMAIEAKNYMDSMAEFLKSGVKYDNPNVQKNVENHLKFLNNNGHTISNEDYVNQTKFFLQDDFHREMLEKQQTGLAYYLLIVAETKMMTVAI
jgi:DNA-binding transcriptional MerR regulator